MNIKHTHNKKIQLVYRHTVLKAPVWIFERVRRRQISSKVVSQQHHLLQAHLLPPLLQGLHKLLLGPLRVGAEQWTAAPAEAQQVQSVDGSAVGQSVQILGPEGKPAPKAVQQNQRSPGLGGRLGE